MTRKEAIEVIEQDIPCEHDTDLIEALEMAIKGLKQEPCEDAISRQAVIDELKKWDWQELYLPIHFKKNIIDVIPSVKPQEPFDINQYCKEHFCVMVDKDVWDKAEKALKQEPKTGHWIFKNGKYRCNVCGEKAIYCYSGSSSITQAEILTKYCPNCGAKMESEL